VGAYYVGILIVVAGVWFGCDALGRKEHPHQNSPGLVSGLCAWDGVWYARIVSDGYDYNSSRHSRVAYFPGFPLISRLLVSATSLDTETAMLVVAHMAFLLSLLALRFYSSNAEDGGYTVLAATIWPTGLFLRMGYGESLFLLLTLLCLLSIQRRAPSWLAAVIAGAATGTRSVGIALLLPLLWDWWDRSRDWKEFLGRCVVFGPVSCWGLIAFIAFQQIQFDEPLAFVKTQAHWSQRPDLRWHEKLVSLISAEPIWTIYVPTSPAYWARHEYLANPLFSLQFWNPIYFLACAGLVAWGAWKKWLTAPEWLLSVGLLGIPFVLQSYRMMMLGHGRFTCVVFPLFIVLGRLFSLWPVPVTALTCALMGIQLFYWSALFAAWHRVF